MSTQERDTLAPGPYVVGGPWHSQEEDENGNRLWMSEIQIVGGHAVVATIYAATENDARSMAERAITAWNTRPIREDARPEKSDAGTVITPVHTSPGADGRHAPKDEPVGFPLDDHQFRPLALCRKCGKSPTPYHSKDPIEWGVACPRCHDGVALYSSEADAVEAWNDDNAHPPRDTEAQWVKDEAVPLLAAIRAQCSTGQFTGDDMKHFYEMIGNALRMRAALDTSGCAS